MTTPRQTAGGRSAHPGRLGSLRCCAGPIWSFSTCSDACLARRAGSRCGVSTRRSPSARCASSNVRTARCSSSATRTVASGACRVGCSPRVKNLRSGHDARRRRRWRSTSRRSVSPRSSSTRARGASTSCSWPARSRRPHPTTCRASSPEIVEAKWFPRDELPALQHETAGALASLARATSERG